MIARFLSTNGHWLLMGVAAIAAWLYINNLHSTIDARTAERDSARLQVTTLSDQINEQNNAVLALEAASAQNREVYLAGLEAANRKAVTLRVDASDYLNAPVPADPQEACRVADQILEGVTK